MTQNLPKSDTLLATSWITWLLVVAATVVARGEPATEPPTSAPNASVLPNGDFEKADAVDRAKPIGWDKPDGLGIQWVNAPGEPGRGKVIRMDTAVSEKAMVNQWRKMGITQWNIPQPAGNPIAETYGLSYYSVPVPVRAGQAYQVSFDFKGPAGGKVWVRGWGMYQGEKRRRYETIVFCRGKENQWTTFRQTFHPTRNRPEVTEMRVMLYAYYPAGVYWFDNVRLEPVSETPKPK